MRGSSPAGSWWSSWWSWGAPRAARDRRSWARRSRTEPYPCVEGALAQKKAQGPFPFPDFNPTKPDLSKLPAIATSEAKTVTIYQTWQRAMLALGQPPTGKGAWAGVLEALESHVRIIEEQQAAAQNGDGQTFTKDYYEGNKAQDEMEKAADAAGVPVCADAAAA